MDDAMEKKDEDGPEAGPLNADELRRAAEITKLEAEGAKLRAEEAKLKGDNHLLSRFLPSLGIVATVVVAAFTLYQTQQRDLQAELARHRDFEVQQSEIA